jgi:hypothetical protein
MNLQFVDGDHGRPPKETARVSAGNDSRVSFLFGVADRCLSSTDLHVYISIADLFLAKKVPQFTNYFSGGKKRLHGQQDRNGAALGG